ncbi:guanine deaminase isoform X1 [Rhodnius prolixus]|uniref:Guanine deaminase n=3 Tax=Rhodnius prolixus TaxID=13249 RepID=R4FNH3_RHOPR
MSYIFIGPVVHSLKKEEITILEEATVTVSNGKIISVNSESNIEEISSDSKVIRLKKGQFLCPGLIDLHIHAPQYPNLGIGMDKPLLQWLSTYTIPLEKKYSDVCFAEKVYNYIVSTTLKCGTTTACYYGTIHRISTEKLAQIASNLGQRALIGKVNMDQNSILDYVETTTESLKETEEFIHSIKKLNDPLIEAVITPRFAITCNMNLLKGLGALASKHKLYIQTHISENKEEVEVVSKLFPECKSYSDVYNQANLLTTKTILGHGVHLTGEEQTLLSKKGVGIAHCPNSNTMLRSGACDVRTLWENGINVGLGTDVSGGCNPSIMDAMRSALATSRHISFHKENCTTLNFHEVFYMATLGGAKALRKDHLIGNFMEGKEFDALIVDMEIGNSLCGSLPEHTLLELVQKFIFCGDDRNIKRVYVNGKLLISKP